MEIYKLSDEVPGEATKEHRRGVRAVELRDTGDFDEGPDEGALKITDIKQAVRNENRVNIYVNNKYVFSLDIAQVVDLEVKVGRVLTAGELSEMKKASEFGKAYQRALEWVLMRPRSERELRDYLKRREHAVEMKERKLEWARDKEIADAVARGDDTAKLVKKAKQMKTIPREKYDFTELIVARLMARGYVDDRKFAEYYVENRFVKKGVSRKRLVMELKQKGVTEAMIDEVMGESERDDTSEIKKIIAKKRGKYDAEKLTRYLCRQGFDYALSRELVAQSYGTD